MCITIFDFDGPLALCFEREFFSWANNQPTVKTPWRYEVLIQTGDWAEATGRKHNTMRLPKEFLLLMHLPRRQM